MITFSRNCTKMNNSSVNKMFRHTSRRTDWSKIMKPPRHRQNGTPLARVPRKISFDYSFGQNYIANKSNYIRFPDQNWSVYRGNESGNEYTVVSEIPPLRSHFPFFFTFFGEVRADYSKHHFAPLTIAQPIIVLSLFSALRTTYRWPPKKRNSRFFFEKFALINSYRFTPCWIEHLFFIIITPRSSNLVENFLFYE